MSKVSPHAVRRTDLEDNSVRRAREAIGRGDQDAALAEIEGILDEARPIHDLNGDLVSSLLTFIADRLGEPAVADAWRYSAEDVWRPVLETFRDDDDIEGLVRAQAKFMTSHRYDFEVYEDDEKFTFVVNHCTSAERMQLEGKVRGNAGTQPGHHRFGSTRHAYEWSLGRSDFPYYDVHSVLWMRMLPAEWGWNVMDIEYEDKPHGHHSIARYHVFKRPRRGADGA